MNIKTLCCVLFVSLMMTGCGNGGDKNTGTNNQTGVAPSTQTKNLSNALKQLGNSANDKASYTHAVQSLMNLPVGKTSLSISIPTKFSQVKSSS